MLFFFSTLPTRSSSFSPLFLESRTLSRKLREVFLQKWDVHNKRQRLQCKPQVIRDQSRPLLIFPHSNVSPFSCMTIPCNIFLPLGPSHALPVNLWPMLCPDSFLSSSSWTHFPSKRFSWDLQLNSFLLFLWPSTFLSCVPRVFVFVWKSPAFISSLSCFCLSIPFIKSSSFEVSSLPLDLGVCVSAPKTFTAFAFMPPSLSLQLIHFFPVRSCVSEGSPRKLRNVRQFPSRLDSIFVSLKC